MSTLHLVRSSAYTDQQLALCTKVIHSGDNVILLDDGCYNVKHQLLAQIASVISNKNIMLIQPHATARNVQTASYQLIDMKHLLALTFSHNNTITWQ